MLEIPVSYIRSPRWRKQARKKETHTNYSPADVAGISFRAAINGISKLSIVKDLFQR